MPWVVSRCCQKIRSVAWSCAVGIFLAGSQSALGQNSPGTDDLTVKPSEPPCCHCRREHRADPIRSEERDSALQLDKRKRMKSPGPVE